MLKIAKKLIENFFIVRQNKNIGLLFSYKEKLLLFLEKFPAN